MKDQEFYIGWMANAPSNLASSIRKLIAILLILIMVAAFLLGVFQKKFSSSTFEYGRLTQVSGVYQESPVPSIRISTGADALGNTSMMTIPLVGYGKFGAHGVIADLENENKISLLSREVTLIGTLIYYDGKTLLQIDKNDNPLVRVGNIVQKNRNVQKDLGHLLLEGEILDPKCYFGVMKPGHGKPHRDCAIRCIAGGISPVFHIKNEEGKSEYFLMLGENQNLYLK